jgi:uncharacterized membrane protein (DUF485 family)
MASDVQEPSAAAAAQAEGAEPQVDELSRRHNRFVWPMTVFFLIYYLALPFLAGTAPGLMGSKVFGQFTFGYLFALSQFLMAFIVAWVYSRWARRRLDPLAEDVRERLHAGHTREVVE